MSNCLFVYCLLPIALKSRDLSADFTLKNCLCRAFKLTKNADSDKYSYLGNGIRSDSRSLFSYPSFDRSKNVILSGVGNSSSVRTDNKKKDMLVLGEVPTQRFDDTTITTEAKYSINFLKSHRKSCLSLHCNGSKSFLFVTATKIY